MMQSIYNDLSRHLMTQFEKSTLNGNPAYRGKDGLKGPVGVLIKDEHYSPDIEGECALETPVVNALNKSGIKVGREMSELLLGFQLIHDEFEPTEWRKMIRKLGIICNLNPIGE